MEEKENLDNIPDSDSGNEIQKSLEDAPMIDDDYQIRENQIENEIQQYQQGEMVIMKENQPIHEEIVKSYTDQNQMENLIDNETYPAQKPQTQGILIQIISQGIQYLQMIKKKVKKSNNGCYKHGISKCHQNDDENMIEY